MLPAVIRDFFETQKIEMSTDLEEIWVVNLSEPRVAGCKCYTRTMREFGFDLVNGIPSEEFCTHDEYDDVMTGTSSSKESVSHGSSTPLQLYYLEQASIRR
jgi:hypothetical protein